MIMGEDGLEGYKESGNYLVVKVYDNLSVPSMASNLLIHIFLLNSFWPQKMLCAILWRILAF